MTETIVSANLSSQKNAQTHVVCCIVARTNSTRLPRKVLKRIGEKTMIEKIIYRMKSVPSLDAIYVATSAHPDDKILCDLAERHGVCSYAGSELSVIDRILDIARAEQATHIVRVTGDNIYTDSKLLDRLIRQALDEKVDYARVEGAPIGVTGEVIAVPALQNCLLRIDPDLSEISNALYVRSRHLPHLRYRCLGMDGRLHLSNG